MFTVIGILTVVVILGAVIMLTGMSLAEGAGKLIIGIVVLAILFFAVKGCAGV